MSVRRAHAHDCPRSAASWEPGVDDPPCTCGETARRKAAKEASGLSGRAFRKSERYEHGHPAPMRVRGKPQSPEVAAKRFGLTKADVESLKALINTPVGRTRPSAPRPSEVPTTLTAAPSTLPHDLVPVRVEVRIPTGFTTVTFPDRLLQDLVDARMACEECGDLNAGDQQRANLNELLIMKTLCSLVRKAYRP